MAKVSIAVAVYNASKYIERNVRRLYEQTLDDIEILLVDDCTQDDSIEIAMRVLEEYPHRKKQVRVIHHERNLGIAETKKDGYLLATGEYVVVIDDDDYIDVHYAEMMYDKAVEEGSDMVICDWYDVSEKGQSICSMFSNDMEWSEDNVRNGIMNRVVTPVLWCKLISKNVVNNSGILWPKNGLGEDTVLSPEFAYYSKKISHVQYPLYYYTLHYDSVSNVRTKTEEEAMKLYNDFKGNVNILMEFYQREGLIEKYALGVFINKLRTKNRLRFYIHKRKYRRLWIETYPEINKILLIGSFYYKPSKRNYLWFFALVMGLSANKKLCQHIQYWVPSCRGVI